VTAQCVVRGDVAVLVVAAGSGVRLGPGVPKALRTLAGEPLLVHALRRVLGCPDVAAVVVAVPADQRVPVRDLLAPLAPPGVPVLVVAGGPTRQESVARALAAVPPGPDIVLVHDAARALAPAGLVARVAAAVRAGAPAVVPVLPVVDTIKQVDPGGAVLGTVDRSALRCVQTPQGFRRAVLVAAHQVAAAGHTDDAGLVERLGRPVLAVPGDDLAMKITRPVDLVIAEALLAASGTLAP